MVKPDAKLQIPLTKKLKKDFDKKCESIGFYSSNEVVRFLMQRFVSGHIDVITNSHPTNNFIDEEYIEIADEETERSIGQSLKDFAQGKCYTLDPTDPKSLARLLSDEEDDEQV